MRFSKIRIVLLLIAIAVAGLTIRDTSYYYSECYNKFDGEKNKVGLAEQYSKRLQNNAPHDLTFEIKNISKPYKGASGYEYRNRDSSLHGFASGDGCGALDVNPDSNDPSYPPAS